MKAPASATASSAMSSAAACCCIWSTAPASMPARPTRRCAPSSRPMARALAEKPEIVALNKIDALTPEELKKQKARLKRAAKKTPLVLSAVDRRGRAGGAARAGRGDRRGPGIAEGEGRGAGRALDAGDAAEADFAAARLQLAALISQHRDARNRPKCETCRARKTSSGSCATSFAMIISAVPAIRR